MPEVLFAGERLSLAELRAACLDGVLVPLGLGYVPADVLPHPALRAAALAPLIGDSYAFVRRTAAWVHGAADELATPYEVQRAVRWRTTRIVDRRIRYLDQALAATDASFVGEVLVSRPAHVLADLARSAEDDPALGPVIERLAADDATRREAIDWFRRHPRRPGAVAAVAMLRALDEQRGPARVTTT